ncbi:MAG: response regulator transcription factor [Phycisphaerae bacterium]|nr:response regulator transcription factor [Phycisphaerae bacterium]
MSEGPIRVLCVDDHPLLVEGIRARLEFEPNLELVGELTSADNLVAAAEKHAPDIVLMDVAMPGLDPFVAATELCRRLPETKTVFLSAHVRDHYLDAAFRAGAWGYLYKGDNMEDIVDALKRVAAGEYVFSPHVLERVRVQKQKRAGRPGAPKRSSKLDALTPTETQVLRMMGKGLSRTQIAQTLHRSVKTIDTHRAALMKKLDIHDRAELAVFAIREGLIDAD